MNVNTTQIRDVIPNLKCGDRILLSGVVYTARDAAHKKISDLIKKELPLPFPLLNSLIYYAGPTQTPQDMPIGSCGPTTSSRMDIYTPKLLDLGLAGTIGKGPRNDEVIQSIIKNRAIYLCALGGAGALTAKSVEECDVVAFQELGCESVKRLVLKDFPLIVGIDSKGNNIFKKDT